MHECECQESTANVLKTMLLLLLLLLLPLPGVAW
jgi:hypothetical protein